MMRAFLEAVTSFLPQPRVIRDRSDKSPYLSRWYLFGKPWMPDGSDPFDASGQTREGMKWSKHGLGVYLHKFHRDDESDELHNHPWKTSVAFVLAGGYVEERRAEVWDPLDDRGARYIVEKRVMKPGTINVISADDFHRVDLIEEDSWSLFITWQKAQTWGFWDRHTNTFTPWRTHLTEWRAVRDAVRDGVRVELDKFVGRPYTPATLKEMEEAIHKGLLNPDAGGFLGGAWIPMTKIDRRDRVTLPREGEEDAGQVEKEGGGGKGTEEA